MFEIICLNAHWIKYVQIFILLCVYSIIMSFIYPNERDDENQIDIDELYEKTGKRI
jgi:hypothetical protein